MDLPLSVLSQVAAILEQLGIRYVLVGSFASSIHGMYRSTADIDIVADIKTEHVRPLSEALRDDFYVDEQAMRDAVSKRRSFNAIHFNSVFKVDFFVPKSDDFSLIQLDRRELRSISPDGNDNVYVATAEDTILAKLRWYRDGHETSNNQWNDVVGVLGTSRHRLDLDYLRSWAEKLGFADLLQKALDDVQEDSGL
jgi:hypothetical protein